MLALLGAFACPFPAWLVWDAFVDHRLKQVRLEFAREGFPAGPADLMPAPASDEENAVPLLVEIDRRLRAPDPAPMPPQAASAPPSEMSIFQGLNSSRAATLNDRVNRIVDLYFDHLTAPLPTHAPASDVIAELQALLGTPECSDLLALAHLASNRPRFVPASTPADKLALLAEHIGTIRTLARLLNVRAALFLRTTGDAEAIWSDILAAERLGRLAAESPSMIHLLTSIACSGINHRNLVDAMSAGALPDNGRDVLHYLLSLELTAEYRFARALAFERVTYLDSIADEVLSAEHEEKRLSEGEEAAEALLFPGLVTKLPRPVQRTWMVVQLTRNYEAFLAMARIFRDVPRTHWIREIQALTAAVGDEPMMAPVQTFGKVVISDLADQARHSGVVIALAASLYRQATGAWPASLADLGLPDTVTVDPCSGQAMHYLAGEDGLLVYADGPDGKDDGGRDWQSGTDRSIMDGDIAVAIKLSR